MLKICIACATAQIRPVRHGATYIFAHAAVLFLCIIGYGIGFFHDQSGVAFSSDNILDLIPVDTTAALLIAAASSAAANGPLPSNQARVYHAASADSHPRGIVAHLSLLRDFWVANPPPFCLPFTRWVVAAMLQRLEMFLSKIEFGTAGSKTMGIAAFWDETPIARLFMRLQTAIGGGDAAKQTL